MPGVSVRRAPPSNPRRWAPRRSPRQRFALRGEAGPPPPETADPLMTPYWAKDERLAFKMINARAETLAEKQAFRSLLGKYRCLVIADGFYEWTAGADGTKAPIHFSLQEDRLARGARTR